MHARLHAHPPEHARTHARYARAHARTYAHARARTPTPASRSPAHIRPTNVVYGSSRQMLLHAPLPFADRCPNLP
eukprot:2125157-Pleurochrysis_carterae.AAC.1